MRGGDLVQLGEQRCLQHPNRARAERHGAAADLGRGQLRAQ